MTIDNKPVNYYQYKAYIFEPILAELGITGKTPHCTRHTLATKLDEVENNKLVIKRILRTRYTRYNSKVHKNINRHLS